MTENRQVRARLLGTAINDDLAEIMPSDQFIKTPNKSVRGSVKSFVPTLIQKAEKEDKPTSNDYRFLVHVSDKMGDSIGSSRVPHKTSHLESKS